MVEKESYIMIRQFIMVIGINRDGEGEYIDGENHYKGLEKQ